MVKGQVSPNFGPTTSSPRLACLQGHPEAAQLWEEHISKILHSLGFTATTHEHNIYSATIDGHKILLLRQVDDFVLATPSSLIATKVYDAIVRFF